MKFIEFSDSGEIIARFDSDIHGGGVPKNAVIVSDELFWRTISENDGIWKRDPVTEEVGKHPLPTVPSYVPQQVTNAQGAAALIQAGLWQSILDYVEGMDDATEKALAEVALHRTTHWQRTSPFLN